MAVAMVCRRRRSCCYWPGVCAWDRCILRLAGPQGPPPATRFHDFCISTPIQGQALPLQPLLRKACSFGKGWAASGWHARITAAGGECCSRSCAARRYSARTGRVPLGSRQVIADQGPAVAPPKKKRQPSPHPKATNLGRDARDRRLFKGLRLSRLRATPTSAGWINQGQFDGFSRLATRLELVSRAGVIRHPQGLRATL